MKVYVVTCYMEGHGCCSNEYHVVGVFQNKKDADNAKKQHSANNGHLHSNYVDTNEFELK